MKSHMRVLAIVFMTTLVNSCFAESNITVVALMPAAGTNVMGGKLDLGSTQTVANADLVTSAGTVYKNYKVLRVEKNGIVIMHKVGVEHISFSDLPEDIQQKYRYDPGKVVEASKQKVEDPFLRRQAALEPGQEKENAEIDLRVRSMMEKVKGQVARSQLLRNYSVTREEFDHATSSDYTSIQRKSTLQALWDRARRHKENREIRMLFVPFPSGIRYIVSDVGQYASGDYYVVLSTNDKVINDIAKALAPADFLWVSFRRPSLRVPMKDADVANWNKNQVIDSGEWLVPIIINDDGKITPASYIIRSEEELAILEEHGKTETRKKE